MTGLGRIGIGALALLALAGCSSQSLSITKDAPDAFGVLTQAPLEIPTDLAALPPPRPGASRPQEVTAAARAAGTFGPVAAPASAAGISDGELAFLELVGAADVPPDIRAVVLQEAIASVAAQTSPMERMFGQPNDLGDVVDAPREAARIQAALAAGMPITTGETPIIARRPRAPLEGWVIK